MINMTATKRIEYIDALRGFTMILVVVHHVSLFCFNISVSTPSFHFFLQEIRMPLFFFISGFVLFKPEVVWDCNYIVNFLKRKIPVQILSPLLFFTLYMYINSIHFLDGFFNSTKNGYWFTFVLFIFYIYYSLIRFSLHFFKVNNYYSDVIILLLGFTFYFLKFLPIHHIYRELFCMQFWYLYVFFTIGTLTKKYYDTVQYYIDERKNILIIPIALFVFFNLFGLQKLSMIIIFLTSLSGLIIVFSFFRYYKDSFSHENHLGIILQYIGRHTLDIYLLHFFFLPLNLKTVLAPIFIDHPLPIIEFSVSLMIALMIIGICLLISNLLRMPPFLGHFLFGAKYES